MKIIAFVLTILGLLAVLLGAFSIFGAMPAMVENIGSLSPEASGAAFWWALATLMFMASIAFSFIDRESTKP